LLDPSVLCVFSQLRWLAPASSRRQSPYCVGRNRRCQQELSRRKDVVFAEKATVEMIMRLALKASAASALLVLGATLALAQTSAQTTPSDSPSKAEPGAPQQGPGKQVPSPTMGTGSRPIGPPSSEQVAPGKNPTGESIEKKKSDSNDKEMGNPPAKK
jgi:hypothetical protein